MSTTASGSLLYRDKLRDTCRTALIVAQRPRFPKAMRTGGGGEARCERRTGRRQGLGYGGDARDAVRPLHRQSRSTIIIDAETGGISSRNDAGYGVRGEGEPVRPNHQLVYGMHTQHVFAGPLSMKPDIRPSRRRPPDSKSLWPQVFLPGLHIKRWIVFALGRRDGGRPWLGLPDPRPVRIASVPTRGLRHGAHLPARLAARRGAAWRSAGIGRDRRLVHEPLDHPLADARLRGDERTGNPQRSPATASAATGPESRRHRRRHGHAATAARVCANTPTTSPPSSPWRTTAAAAVACAARWACCRPAISATTSPRSAKPKT